MKPKFTMILMLLALGVQLLNAQQKTVSGTVSDENGLHPTDFDGNYQIKASTGDVLEISCVGYGIKCLIILIFFETKVGYLSFYRFFCGD